MGVSFSEIRKVCQAPVASGNDVAGLLFGDRLSLPFTKLLLDLQLSPSIATVGMLVCGLLGAVLQFAAGWGAVLGAALLLLYYVLDCVDGEVARWRRVEHSRWGYYEYIFHFVVKPVAFLCVGFALWRGSESWVPIVAAVSAAISTLWLKLFLGTPAIVFAGAVLGRGASGTRPYREYIPEARDRAGVAQAPQPTTASEPEVFRLRLDRVTLRALATNFDVGLLLLVVATLLDLGTGPFELFGVPGLSVRGLWLLYYGVVLPLDFVDYLRSYFQRGHFDAQMVRLLARAHGFQLPLRAESHERVAD